MRRQSGFTLYELLIVVTIIGILAAIAYPAYTGQVRQGRRAEAMSAMQDLALQQEQHRTNNTTYGTLADFGYADPWVISDFFTITITGNTATDYLITATATGDQANDTGCTALTLDEGGRRTPADCW